MNNICWLFLGLQNGVRPTERALLQFTQPRRNFIYYKIWSLNYPIESFQLHNCGHINTFNLNCSSICRRKEKVYWVAMFAQHFSNFSLDNRVGTKQWHSKQTEKKIKIYSSTQKIFCLSNKCIFRGWFRFVCDHVTCKFLQKPLIYNSQTKLTFLAESRE